MNWNPAAVPLEGTALSLTFGAAGAGGTNLTVDVNNDANSIAAFILNRLTFTNNAAGGNVGTVSPYVLSGSALQFAGTAPQIYYRNGATNNTVTIGNDIIIAANNMMMTITGSSGTALVLNGTITSTQDGPITLTLAGSNSINGTINGVVQNGSGVGAA